MLPKLIRSSIIACILSLAATTSGALACSNSISQGTTCQSNTCPWFIGGDQYVSQNMSYLSATMKFYNPYPVWTTSSIWLAFETQFGMIAQVGYLHDGISGQGRPSGVIFVEYTYNNGSYSNVWEYNTPSSYENFSINYIPGGTPAFYFCWTENCSGLSTNNPGWNPTNIDTYGEIHDYTATTKGSQAVGAVNSRVQTSSIQWVNASGTPYNANLNYGAPVRATAAYQYRLAENGYTWDTWDSRCNT